MGVENLPVKFSYELGRQRLATQENPRRSRISLVALSVLAIAAASAFHAKGFTASSTVRLSTLSRSAAADATALYLNGGQRDEAYELLGSRIGRRAFRAGHIVWLPRTRADVAKWLTRRLVRHYMTIGIFSCARA
jgi:hypothetical protein